MLPDRTRWSILGACVVTVLAAWAGMDSLWDYGDYAISADSTWFRFGLPLGIALALGAAYYPMSDVPRLLRVAVVLPIIHLAAIAVVAHLAEIVNEGIRAFPYHSNSTEYVAVPPLESAAIAAAVLLNTAVIIKRRNGEWAH